MKEPNENDFHKQDKQGYWYFDSEDYAEACREYERQKLSSPLPSNEDDELWNEIVGEFQIYHHDERTLSHFINYLKSKFSITRK